MKIAHIVYVHTNSTHKSMYMKTAIISLCTRKQHPQVYENSTQTLCKPHSQLYVQVNSTSIQINTTPTSICT